MTQSKNYNKIFENLRTNKNRTYWTASTLYQAPYKPLLLLAVMDAYADGEINTNLIELTTYLEDLFFQYLSLAHLRNHSQECLALPFWHLQSDGFWHLVPRPGNHVTAKSATNAISISSLTEDYLGAKLDEELYRLITEENSRTSLRYVLIKNYFSPTIQDRLIKAIANKGLYQKGVQAFRDGNQKIAFRLLVETVKKNPRNCSAWYLLSQVVETSAQRLDCLSRVLKLAPNHEKARQQITLLESELTNNTSFASLEQESLSKAITQGTASNNMPETRTLNLDDLVKEWMSPLTYTEQTVINHLYLDTYKFTMAAVARIISASPDKLDRVHQGALSKLAAGSQYRIIKPFVPLILRLTQSSNTFIAETDQPLTTSYQLVAHKMSLNDVAALIKLVREQGLMGAEHKLSEQVMCDASTAEKSEPNLNMRETPTPYLSQIYVLEQDFSLLENDTTAITSLRLSARVFHALERANIETIGQLVNVYPKSNVPDQRWLAPGIGPTSLKEIGDKLSLYMSTNASSALIEDSTLLDEPQSTEQSGKGRNRISQTEYFERPSPLLHDDSSIAVLGLSRRTYNALFRAGVATISKLVALSREQLFRIRNVGDKAVTEIEIQLRHYSSTFDGFLEEGNVAQEPSVVLQDTPATQARLSTFSQQEPTDLLSFLTLFDSSIVESLAGIPLDKLGVGRLGLSADLEKQLQEIGVFTIRQLLESRARLIGYREIVEQLKRYLQWLSKQDRSVWQEEIAGKGISPLHLQELANTTLESLVASWLSTLPARTAEVIALRYGLNGIVLTLKEIGENLNVSRERIRQIQKRGLQTLQKSYEYWKKSHLTPILEYLNHCFVDWGGILTYSELDELFQKQSIIHTGNINPLGVLRLLCELDDRFQFYEKGEYITLSNYPIRTINNVHRSFAQILSDNLANMSSSSLMHELKQTKIYSALHTVFPEQFFLACLRVHPELEQIEPDLYALGKSPKRRMAAIVTAMREIGEPAHYSTITKKTNSLLPPLEQFTERALHAKLGQHPDIFVWTRLRGTYGLKEWGLEQGLSYVDAIEQVFLAEGKPLTFEQVIERMPAYREHFDEASVTITLGTHERFRALANNRYGLSSWNNKSSGLDFADLFGEQLAQRQAELDRQNNVKFDTQTEVEKIRRVGIDFLTS
jgi:RNA polymerase sigma factor (sigma-70 family)